MTTELNIALAKVLTQSRPDFEKAKELMSQGADINGEGEHGFSIVEQCILACAEPSAECDTCDEDSCFGCEKKRRQHLLAVVEFVIENGWDTKAHGLKTITPLVHSTHDKQMFYAAKRIMECPLSESKKEYERALECIGTEESYQRCCENCHEEENLYYAMYEVVKARMDGSDFSGIYPYYDALGKCVDKIVYFADTVDFVETPRGTEYTLDFGFICGDEVVLIGPNLNVLLMNHLLHEQPQRDVSDTFGEGVVGSRIVDISLEHKEISTPQGHYGQPTIVLKFESGKEIRFTHNAGERPKEGFQPRFVTAEAQKRIDNRIEGLFQLCAATCIDLDKIESYIVGAEMTPEDVTRTALRLVETFECEVDSFTSAHGRSPKAEELVTSNWLELFDLFWRYGLDTASSLTMDNVNYQNILQNLIYVDNKNIVYKLLRLLLNHGADPNVMIKDERLFELLDDNAVINATLCEIEGEDRVPYEHDFRLWLLMMAYGGKLSSGKSSLKIKDGFDIEMFANCEAFSYRKEITKDDWYLHIYITKTGEEVAIL